VFYRGVRCSSATGRAAANGSWFPRRVSARAVLPNWGSEGWDAGSWPYIIFAVPHTRDKDGEQFGYGNSRRGRHAAHWFGSQEACFKAITAEVFFHWTSGQSDGAENLPATAAQLPDQDRKPYPGWTS
jgi:hypothetical protein